VINHLSIGVKDIARSKAFYDATLKALGYKRLSESADSLGYGKDAVVLWISATEHPVPADPKSGLHICFDAPTRDSVDAFYKAAMRSGGQDNGKPGIRAAYDPTYYAAFAVDPDGYRVEAYCSKEA